MRYRPLLTPIYKGAVNINEHESIIITNKQTINPTETQFMSLYKLYILYFIVSDLDRYVVFFELFRFKRINMKF